MLAKKQMTVVVYVAITSDSNIKEKVYKELKKYQGQLGELEKIWRVKVTVLSVVIGAFRAVTAK